MSSLTVKNISKKYEPKTVIDGVTISISEGEKVALVGENGTGKTTLLRILAGEEEPTEGRVIFDERTNRVYMSQEFPNVDNLRVRDFLGNEKVQRFALRCLEELGFRPNILEAKTNTLSGGEKKIMQLIRLFASKSPFLLLDEPENHLDYFTRECKVPIFSDTHSTSNFDLS